MAAKKKEVAVVEEQDTALVVASQYETDAASYESDIGQDDMALPFIQVLQKGSPQVDEDDARHIPGAKAGMYFNTVTQEMFEEIDVIPVSYRLTFIEWIIREDGGGFVADHGPEGEALLETTTKDDKGRDILPNGHQLVRTATYIVGHVHPARGFDPAVMTMTSTQLKKSRAWNTVIKSLRFEKPGGGAVSLGNIPWAGMYHFSTVPEQNEKGSWRGLKIVPHPETPFTPADLYNTAKGLREAVMGGAVKVDMAKAEDVPTTREPGEDDGDDAPSF